MNDDTIHYSEKTYAPGEGGDDASRPTNFGSKECTEKLTGTSLTHAQLSDCLPHPDLSEASTSIQEAFRPFFEPRHSSLGGFEISQPPYSKPS